MAIKYTHTKEDTGAVLPNAHMVLADPDFDGQKQTVTLRGTIWASKAAYDAKKAPEGTMERVFPVADYVALRTANLNTIEPALLNRYPAVFVAGVRVPD